MGEKLDFENSQECMYLLQRLGNENAWSCGGWEASGVDLNLQLLLPCSRTAYPDLPASCSLSLHGDLYQGNIVRVSWLTLLQESTLGAILPSVDLVWFSDQSLGPLPSRTFASVAYSRKTLLGYHQDLYCLWLQLYLWAGEGLDNWSQLSGEKPRLWKIV